MLTAILRASSRGVVYKPRAARKRQTHLPRVRETIAELRRQVIAAAAVIGAVMLGALVLHFARWL